MLWVGIDLYTLSLSKLLDTTLSCLSSRPLAQSSAPLHSSPLDPLTPRDASSPVPPAVPPGVGSGSNSDSDSDSNSDPIVSDAASFAPACAAAAFSLANLQSIPDCSHLWDSCPPPSLHHLAEPKNRPCRNKLRDRILSPEDRCLGPHDPRLL